MFKFFRTKHFVRLFWFAFGLNVIWEFAHSILYANHTNYLARTPVLLRASLGDAFYILIIYIFSVWVIRFIKNIRNSRLAIFMLVFILGLLAGLLNEWIGLHFGRWSYAASMPIVPILKIGLSPFVQLAVTSVLALYLNKSLENRWMVG